MAYGVTTSRAHIDTLDRNARAANEIDWGAIIEWKGRVPPTFVGRYFLGTPTQAEVDSGVGFCLWAHGEGFEPSAPERIVPLQRADPDRQQAEGTLGANYGADDALAIGTYLQRCLDVGDLELPAGTNFVLVFLEVGNGTRLSFDYWSTWASNIHAWSLDLTPQAGAAMRTVQPLRPAIACAFTRANQQSLYLPETPVGDCLRQAAPAGRHSQCYGLWSRTAENNPKFGEFIQDPKVGPVPVYYWCSFDGPGGSPLPTGTSGVVVRQRQTLPLITIDEHATGVEDPTLQTFERTAWTAAERPIQCGVDTNKRLTTSAQCIAASEIVIRRLPSGIGVFDNGENLDHDPLRARSTIAFRYYSTRSGQEVNRKDLTRDEAKVISRAGLGIVVVWEAFAGTYKEIRDHFLAAEQGKRDASNAFLYAADTINQPIYTPVYFAVDFPPGDTYGNPPLDEWLMPSLEQVLVYFRDVHRGYREYLRTHPSMPYYIGMYAQASVCAAAYRAGLATHFWQPWPPTWGDNWAPFPHANAWQVVLENTEVSGGTPDLWDDNAAVKRCTAVDLNVAWGDPGSWEIYG